MYLPVIKKWSELCLFTRLSEHFPYLYEGNSQRPSDVVLFSLIGYQIWLKGPIKCFNHSISGHFMSHKVFLWGIDMREALLARDAKWQKRPKIKFFTWQNFNTPSALCTNLDLGRN